jgi:hypothetical protein
MTILLSSVVVASTAYASNGPEKIVAAPGKAAIEAKESAVTAKDGDVAHIEGLIGGTIGPAELPSITGMPVTGADGETLGMVASVDVAAEEVELRTPDGLTVTMPSVLFGREGEAVIAPTTSQEDIAAMAKTQAMRQDLALL